MLFHSLDFALFFPVVVFFYFILPNKWKNIWLLIASYFFYMNWNAKYGLLLLGASVITYVGSLLVNRYRKDTGRKRAVLVVALFIVFSILVYYKYTNFMIQSINRLVDYAGISLVLPTFDIILPVGISFFTFQAAGHLIDVYRGDVEVEKNPLDYLLFVSFFPQLVAGPIERSKNLLQQMHRTNTFDMERAQLGLRTMLWGFFLKLVIADRCAVIVDYVFPRAGSYGTVTLFFTAILFSIQIYCDFMGYSTIARGAALVLGFELMENFQQPYFATSIQDFWRRWHISLSTWFKDYLYIPLGGNRCSKLRHYVNLMITFLVSGLWHGASWAFVFWGGLHGILQVMGSLCRPAFLKIHRLLHIPEDSVGLRMWQRLRTDFLAVIAWILFRAESVNVAKTYFTAMALNGMRWHELWDGTILSFGLLPIHLWILLIAIILLIVFSYYKEQGKSLILWIGRQYWYVRFGTYWGVVILISLSLSLTGQEFIYFQF